MSLEYQQRLNEFHREDLMRQARHHRLAREAIGAQPQPSNRFAALAKPDALLKYALLPVVILFLMFAFVGKSQAQGECATGTDVETFLSQGEEAFKQQDYEAAIAAYSCAVNLEPNQSDAYFGRQEAYVLNDQWDYAIDDAQLAVTYSNDIEADTSALEQRYTAMIEDAPNSVEGYVLRSHLFAFMARYDEALADYARILEIDPSNTYALVNRALVHSYEGNYENGEADITRALEIAPDDPQVLGWAGAFYGILGDLETAMSVINRAVEIDPDHVSNLLRRARVFRDLEDYEAAIADYERALELNSESVEQYLIYYGLGVSNLEIGNAEAAQESFDAAIAVDPENPDPYLSVARAYAETNLAETGRYILQSIELDERETRVEPALTIGEPASLDMEVGRVYRLPFEAEEGKTLTITVNGSDNTIDPVAALLDPDGNPLVGNDDIELGLQRNSLIEGFAVPEDGTYTLVISVTWAGASGTAEVLVAES
jgi:tetratricopeptide (TPR) repeat protein